MQMVHSSLTIQEAAESPLPGKSPEDLNMHIATYLAAGWQMSFYAVHTTCERHPAPLHLARPGGGVAVPRGDGSGAAAAVTGSRIGGARRCSSVGRATAL